MNLNHSVAPSNDDVDEVARSARLAQTAYQALLALGPQHTEERAELLAAGVPSATIETLYPSDFEQLVPGIIEHLASTGMAHLEVELDWLPQLAPVRAQGHFIQSMPPELGRSFVAANVDFQSREANRQLARFIEPHLYALTPWPAAHARDLNTALWLAHWLMRHRAQLQDVGQRRADALLLLLAERLLPNLISKK